MNQTRVLNLSDWDQMLVLCANTDKEMLNIIKKRRAIGGTDRSRILHDVLSELQSEYGCSVSHANALAGRLNSFSIVKSPYESKLKELITLCQHIESNVVSSPELAYFNSDFGAQKVWIKMPNSLQNSYRSASDDYRSHNGSQYPPFSFIVKFWLRNAGNIQTPTFNTQLVVLTVVKKIASENCLCV